MGAEAFERTDQIAVELNTKFIHERRPGCSLAGNMPFRKDLLDADSNELVARNCVQRNAQTEINLEPPIFELLPCVAEAKHESIRPAANDKQAGWRLRSEDKSSRILKRSPHHSDPRGLAAGRRKWNKLTVERLGQRTNISARLDVRVEGRHLIGL